MKTVSILDFGAVENNKLQTSTIQKAIDHVFLAGGGKVIVPKGVYLTCSTRLRSNINLHLEKGAILRGSQNPEDYFYMFFSRKLLNLWSQISTDSRAKVGKSVNSLSERLQNILYNN